MSRITDSLSQKSLKEAVRFGMVGVVATALHYGLYYLLLSVASPAVAFTIGYAVSFVCNYVLSSRFTFRVAMSVQRFSSFALSHLVNYFVGLTLLNVFLWLGLSPAIAPLPTFVISVPINFLLVRYALRRVPHQADSDIIFRRLTGFGMLLLNLLDMPTLSDDMVYRMMWSADADAEVQTIGGIGDLISSQWVHYHTVNGRLPMHLLAQAFLVFVPAVVLQVINTVLFVVLVHLCVLWIGRTNPLFPSFPSFPSFSSFPSFPSFSKGGVRGGLSEMSQPLFVAVMVVFLLFVVFSGFRTTMVWSLGTFNYLWVLVAVLALLLFLRREYAVGMSNTQTARSLHLLYAAPLALLAGWSHEGLSLPLAVAFFFFLIINRKRLSRSIVICLLCFFLGTALCFLSPGIIGRSTEGITLTTRLISAAMTCLSNIRVLWLLLLVLLILARRCRPFLLAHLQAHVYAYIALSVSLAITLLCGTSLERVAFFTDFMAMLLLLRLLSAKLSALWLRRLTVAACALMLVCFVPAYIVRQENRDMWDDMSQQMREPGRELVAVQMPQMGENMLMDYFRQHYVMPSAEFGFYCVYMGFDATDSNMRCAAKLFGKQRLVFLPADAVRRIERDSTAYSHYDTDMNNSLYLWRMADSRPVRSVRFILSDEDVSALHFWQRPLVYDGDTYELDDFHFETVQIGGRPYLVFTRPTTNITRRIKDIEIGYE